MKTEIKFVFDSTANKRHQLEFGNGRLVMDDDEFIALYEALENYIEWLGENKIERA